MKDNIMKTTQNSEREVSSGKAQKLASFFDSIDGSFTHIKHQPTVQTKGLSSVCVVWVSAKVAIDITPKLINALAH
jgi:hypothetical protein